MFTLTFVLTLVALLAITQQQLSAYASSGTVVTASSVDDDINFNSFVGAISLPYAVSDMTAVTVPESFFTTNDGPRIYLMGGCTSDQTCDSSDQNSGVFCYCTEITGQVVYFTPETNLYHTDVAAMPQPRYRHMAARKRNYIYVAGGRDILDNVLTNIIRFNVYTNVWESVVDWPAATSDGVAFTTPLNDYLYIVSGYSQQYSIVGAITALNTTTGLFLPNGTFPDMNVPRGDTQIASLYDLQYYVIGGWSTADNSSFCYPSKVVEYFDVVQNQWFTVDHMLYGRGDLAAGVLDNMIFAIGGEAKSSSDPTCTNSVPVKNVERYANGASNYSWVVEENIPVDIFRFVGATYNTSNTLYSSAIYLFGGQGTYNAETQKFPVLNSTLVYYPEVIYGNSRRKEKLDAAGIAGIVVAGFVVLACCVFGLVSGLIYRYSYYKYNALEDMDGKGNSSADLTSDIGGGQRFPATVMSGGSKSLQPGEQARKNQEGESAINMINSNYRAASVPSDQDLEIMEMQESFPEHINAKGSQTRAVAQVSENRSRL